jgi:SAM-dependent methyltransferase
MLAPAHDEGSRRLNTRPWDHDFVLMRQIADAFRKLIRRHLGTARDLTFVDYGCGSLPYRALFVAHCARYIGADLPPSANADIFLDDDGNLPLADATIDVIVSSQVLEHVRDVEHYLAESHRVLKDQGLLLLSTHGTWIYHPHPTDLRRWTGWGLRFDIERCGFAVCDSLPCMGPLAYSTQLQLLLVKGLLLRLGVVGRWLAAPFCMLCQLVMWLEERMTPAWLKNDNASVYVVAARKTAASTGAAHLRRQPLE